MAVVMSSVVFDLIIVSMKVPKTNKVHILSDLLLLLGSCIQVVVHAIFFVTDVVPLACHLMCCRLGNLDHKLLPAPAWFPCIVGIASIITATGRIFPVNKPEPNLPDGVDPDLVLMTLRCILLVAVANMAVFVPVVTARSWKDVVQRCNSRARAKVWYVHPGGT